MISALLYLQYHSLRNRLAAWIRRLRKLNYLAAAVVGGVYFYFFFCRFLFHPGSAVPGSDLLLPAAYRPLIESLGALALFLVVFLGWIIPHERAALSFTEAEIAFLFPAPVSRRGLIHYKLLRSQTRILFSVLVLSIFSRRFGGQVWTHALGWWLIFSTLNLHFLGSSFTQTMLMDRGLSTRLRRLLVLVLALAGVAAVAVWAGRTMPEAPAPFLANLRGAADWAQQLLNAGPALVLLYPFRLLTRPFLAPDAHAFCLAAGPALLVFALHYAWVIRSDVAFEEASVEAAQKLAAARTAGRAGSWDPALTKMRSRKPFFNLAPAGPRTTALLWKNLLSARQVFSPRIWISVAVMIVCVLAALGDSPYWANTPVILAVVITVLLFWSLLVGPLFFRQDLRQDLALADVLKSYPMRGWQLVWGELLAPAAILAFGQWLLLGCDLLCVLRARQGTSQLLALDLSLLWALTFAACLLLPLLNVLLLLIPNAAILLFPAWIQHGRDAPRGFEAVGQRLIFMLGQILVFAFALLPAALVFALAFFLITFFLSAAPAVVAGSLGAAAVLAAEAALSVMLLGRLFERFDLSEQSAG